jgi:phosphatidylcholine synthase
MAPPVGIRIGAWATHALTASGMLAGYLALDCFSRLDAPHAARNGWLWLLLALFIDGVDGTFARHFRVKEVLPRMDGGMIDAVVDFANYALIPTFFLHQSGLLPDGWLGYLGVAAILIGSALYYGKLGMVSSDLYFVGFPVLWNVAAFFLYFIFGWPAWVNLCVVLVLAAAQFVPLKFLYPSRAGRWRGLHVAASVLGGWATLGVLLLESDPWLPLSRAIAVGSLVYFFGMSLLETWLGARRRT